MKVCGQCGLLKEDSEFHKNQKKADGLRDRCKLCSKEYHRGHYKANKARYIKRAWVKKQEFAAFVNGLKNKPCADCGIVYSPWVMQFDHVRGKKEGDVSVFVGHGSIKKILKEIEKCDLVCANCHADRTHKRRVQSDVGIVAERRLAKA
jgi:hypothetical protein